jgi:hypothetical protein
MTFDPKSMLDTPTNPELADPARLNEFIQECRAEVITFRKKQLVPFLKKNSATEQHVDILMFVFLYGMSIEMLSHRTGEVDEPEEDSYAYVQARVVSLAARVLSELSDDVSLLQAKRKMQ